MAAALHGRREPPGTPQARLARQTAWEAAGRARLPVNGEPERAERRAGQAMVLVRWRSYLSVMVKLLLRSAGAEVTATLEPLVLTRS